MYASKYLFLVSNNLLLSKLYGMIHFLALALSSFFFPLSQVLFKYPPGKKLAMRLKDLAAFCFPGGVKV